MSGPYDPENDVSSGPPYDPSPTSIDESSDLDNNDE